MTWCYPLTFDTQETFLCMCGSLSCPKREGSGGPLILYLNRVLPLFVLAMTITLIIVMTITLKCLQETNTGYLPCSVVTFISDGNQEAACKCLNWSPPVSCLKKC